VDLIASRNFLAWNGTELICANGHGLLHLPALPTCWFPTQRWIHLDASSSSHRHNSSRRKRNLASFRERCCHYWMIQQSFILLNVSNKLRSREDEMADLTASLCSASKLEEMSRSLCEFNRREQFAAIVRGPIPDHPRSTPVHGICGDYRTTKARRAAEWR